MKKSLLAALALFSIGCAVLFAGPKSKVASDGPQYGKNNELLRPANYRDWVYLSTGLGMNYGATSEDPSPLFTNVFVNPSSYKAFLATGKWPNGTIWVVEERGSATKGSINKVGHYQTEDLMGLGVEVKDSRFPDTWTYFGFDATKQSTAAVTPAKNACYHCHEDHGAVEHTFVQFYPTLKPIAEKFGVYKKDREQVPRDEAAAARDHGPETSTWTGSITDDSGVKHLVLHVYGSAGNQGATVDSLDEHQMDMPVTSINLTDSSLRFTMKQFNVEYSGTGDSARITGALSENGKPLPLVLTRSVPPESARK